MKKLCSLFLAVLMLLSVTAGMEMSASAANVTGDQIVAEARKHIGKRYVSGAAGPDEFDCSGLTMYVFAKFGISLPHSTYDIYGNPTKYGTVIATNSYTKAVPGDLICWYGHIGIYTGIFNYNGTMRGFLVDAANPSKGVVEQPIWPSNGDYKVIRVNGVSSTPALEGVMTVPKIKLDKDSYEVGSKVTISWDQTSSETDFRNYHLTITNSLTNEVYADVTTADRDVTKSTYTYKIGVPGTYNITVYAVPYNEVATRQRSASKSLSVGKQVDSIDQLRATVLIETVGEGDGDIPVEEYKEVILLDGWAYDKDGKVYLGLNNEYLAKGWVRYSAKWYYFGSDNVMKKGWLKQKNQWYYLSTGPMATGWTKVNNKWYYMNSSGVMQTGWQKIKDVWYYLNTDGSMQTGWKKLGNYWYYMDGQGAMVTGWRKIGGSWYYMLSSGRMKTGWLKDDDKWYYLEEEGQMRYDSLDYKGKTYHFNKSGVCTNP